MAEIKISELEETNDLNGLFTIGTDKNNLSKKVALQFLKDAANYANAQGEYAQMVADNIYGNVGVADYPEFSASESYKIGDIVRYNGVLYVFVANHAASDWNGKDIQTTSINAKVSELEADVIKLKLLVEEGVVIEGGGIPIVESEEQLVLLDAPIGSVASVVQLIQVAPMAEGETQPETAPYIVDFYLHDADGWKPMAKQSQLDEKVNKEYVDTAIANAITSTLNTEV